MDELWRLTKSFVSYAVERDEEGKQYLTLRWMNCGVILERMLNRMIGADGSFPNIKVTEIEGDLEGDSITYGWNKVIGMNYNRSYYDYGEIIELKLHFGGIL